MKSSKPSDIFKPFKDLKFLLDKKALSTARRKKNCIEVHRIVKTDIEKESQLFLNAMEGVKPFLNKNITQDLSVAIFEKGVETDTEPETMVMLKHLVESGKGFVVADTPEYMEGLGYKVHPDIAKRLHRGDFAIQGEIDLHGLTAKEAHREFDFFLKEAIRNGKRGVRIIHGRGLSSASKPVLKTKVFQWLTSGPWRKWVIAFSSARLCDGGAGATYVLLRQRPVTKRLRKQKNARLLNFINA